MVEYKDAPTYIVHGDDTENGKTFTATDGSGDTIVIAKVDDGYTINGTKLYSAEKVDALLSALDTKLTNLMGNKDNAVKSWASSQFQPKS